MATLISTFFQPQRMVLLLVQLVLQSMMLPSLQPSDPVMVINRVCPKIKRGVFCVSVFHHCSFGEELERWDLPTTFDQQQTQKSLCSYNRTTEELTTGAAEPEEVVIVGRRFCCCVAVCSRECLPFPAFSMLFCARTLSACGWQHQRTATRHT